MWIHFFVVVLFCIYVSVDPLLLRLPPPDPPTTLPPSTTPPLHSIPPDPTRASDRTVTDSRGTVPPRESPRPPRHAALYSLFILCLFYPATSPSAIAPPEASMFMPHVDRPRRRDADIWKISDAKHSSWEGFIFQSSFFCFISLRGYKRNRCVFLMGGDIERVYWNVSVWCVFLFTSVIHSSQSLLDALGHCIHKELSCWNAQSTVPSAFLRLHYCCGSNDQLKMSDHRGHHQDS